MVDLTEKENNDFRTFEIALEGLKFIHEKMNGLIGKRLHLFPADSDTSVWGTDISLLERTDIFEELANHLDAHIS